MSRGVAERKVGQTRLGGIHFLIGASYPFPTNQPIIMNIWTDPFCLLLPQGCSRLDANGEAMPVPGQLAKVTLHLDSMPKLV